MTRLTALKKDNLSNPEDFDAIKKAAEYILANMKQVAKAEKQETTTVASSTKLEKQKSLESQKSMNDHLPEIPADVYERIDKFASSTPALEGFSKHLIKTLQTHVDKSKSLDEKQLESAAVVGVEIMECLVKEYKVFTAIQSRYKTLISALFTNTALRKTLIARIIVASKFIHMKGQELLSKDAAKKLNEMLEEEQAGGRSDIILEYKRKHGAKSVMFECIHCNSKNVDMKQQQTRGADEPMTNFYSCMDCGK